MADWNQPTCSRCWYEREPDRYPVSIAEGHRTVEQCAFCGCETKSGIYVRQDPATVPYPTKDND